MKHIKLLLCAVMLCAFYRAVGQDYIYATGVPHFGTALPVDHGIVNVNNGDVHLEIPLATHPQRGRLTLEEKLVYDSRIWKIVQNGSSYSWQASNVPNSYGGWIFSSGLGAGTISYQTWGGNANCPNTQAPYLQWSQYNNWKWTDPRGTVHSFPGIYTLKYSSPLGGNHCTSIPSDNPTGVGDSLASDGSGYVLSLSNYTATKITDTSGNVYYPTTSGSTPGAVQAVDSNGNYWTTDSNGNLVDDRGLTPILTTISGNTIYYDVLGVGGARQRYTVTLGSVSYQTAFSQTAVSEASGFFNAIQEIALPDGSSYTFSYDSYGELASMTLPSGGTIGYSYANYQDSFNNKNRWLSGITRDGGTTAFTPAVISQCSSSSGCQEQVTVTSPASNDTVYNFSLDKTGLVAGASWKQSVTAFQGHSTGGTALVAQADQYTYYTLQVPNLVNGPPNQNVGYYTVAAGITTTTTLSDVGLTQQTTTSLTGSGAVPTEGKFWDYYSGSAPAQPTTDTTYGYYSGVVPNNVTVKDGSGNTISKVTYGYDEGSVSQSSISTGHTSAPGPTRINQTSKHEWINTSGTTFDSSATFDDAGTMLTATDPNGKTTYGHDNTDTFTTSVTPPITPSGISLTWSTSYDASTGIVTNTTDANGQTTTNSSFDPLNRPQLITYPDGGHAYLTYDPTYTIVAHDIDGGSSRVDTRTHFDPYGRIDRHAQANGQGTSPWYQVDVCFDTTGNVSFQSVPFQGSGWAVAKNCSSAGDATTYDALGRITKVSHADASYAQYSYRGRATQVTDENGVSRIMQSDGLSRLTTVCEISASGMGVPVDNPVPCINSAGAGLDIAGTGFLTQYVYSLVNHTSTITQGLQTRVMQADWLGRTTSMQEPERGATTFSYAYNSTGLQVMRKRIKANQSNVGTLTTTTTQYDQLGRILSVVYDDGTPTKQFSYDDANYLNAPQVHRTNVKGLPSTAMTYVPNTSNMVTGVQYSYDGAGRVTSMWECGAAVTCGNGALARNLTFSYDYAGRQTGVSDPVAGNIVYGLSVAGEITGITNTTYNNSTNPGALVSAVQNGPYGPTSFHLGNGLTSVMTYDSSGRSGYKWLCAGGVTTAYCSGGTQIYGLLTAWKGPYLANSIDTTENTGGYYTYDSLGRVTAYTGNQGQPTSYTWAYDRYGNRYSATPGANITISPNTNLITTPGFLYDAAGNETNDGVHSYKYDAEYSLISVDGGTTATYTYNALNQRMGISNAQGTREFTYDFAGRRMGTWIPGTNTGTQGQIWWGNSPIAYRDNDNSVYFQQADWVGTQRILTNYAGSVASAYISRPWGEAYTTTGKDDNLFHYAGLEQSENTGILHAQFRDYDSSLGRWLVPDSYTGSYDWSNPQSFNRFSYAVNNPTFLIDPTGLQAGPCPPGSSSTFCATAPCKDSSSASCKDNGEWWDPFDWPGLFFSWRPSFHGSLRARPQAPNNPTRLFLPPNAQTCTGMGKQFYAPPQFNLSNVTAAGQAGGRFNLSAMNSAVGHFGTFDYQRVGTPSSFTFYSGYTPVSNIDVGAYLYGAGFSQSQAGMISNTFASLFSKNAGDPNQAIYRNLGYQMAAGKGSYSCSAIPQ